MMRPSRKGEEMHILKPGSVLMLAALVTACGEKQNPAGPNSNLAGAPAVTGLTISGDDYILAGSTSIFTATATLSDGSTRTVVPVWSSSATDVAAIDNAGTLSGRTHGSTTLTAAHDGRNASKSIQVVNNYSGSWSGRYVVKVCADSGIFKDGIYGGDYVDVPWCQALDGVGSMHAFAFTLSQTGRNYSEIRASFGADGGLITGQVTADGRLNLNGTVMLPDWYGDQWGNLQFSGWDTSLDGSGSMIGHWTQNLTMVGQQGNAYEEVELVTMSRR